MRSIQSVSAKIIDGKAVAAGVRAEVAEQVLALRERTGRVPGLATVLVGDDPGSAVYVAGKQRACAEVGMKPFDVRLGADASFEAVAGELARLNADEEVSGILLQLPVPDHLDGPTLTNMVPAEKDVDGLTPVNTGLLSLGLPGLRSCTPTTRSARIGTARPDIQFIETSRNGRRIQHRQIRCR